MTNDKLLAMFLENGLLQFGRFERDGQVAPVILNLELLPSYPETLQYIAEKAAEKLRSDFERIVCVADSLPLGTAISLQTNIPLVYSRGKGESPVYDLVGAYDVGHPAILVMNTLQSATEIQQFVARAKQVGLHIRDIFAVINLNEDKSIEGDYNVHQMLTLDDAIHQLTQTGHLTKGQADAVSIWIGERQNS